MIIESLSKWRIVNFNFEKKNLWERIGVFFFPPLFFLRGCDRKESLFIVSPRRDVIFLFGIVLDLNALKRWLGVGLSHWIYLPASALPAAPLPLYLSIYMQWIKWGFYRIDVCVFVLLFFSHPLRRKCLFSFNFYSGETSYLHLLIILL